jgi:hypothetical protein
VRRRRKKKENGIPTFEVMRRDFVYNNNAMFNPLTTHYR